MSNEVVRLDPFLMENLFNDLVVIYKSNMTLLKNAKAAYMPVLAEVRALDLTNITVQQRRDYTQKINEMQERLKIAVDKMQKRRKPKTFELGKVNTIFANMEAELDAGWAEFKFAMDKLRTALPKSQAEVIRDQNETKQNKELEELAIRMSIGEHIKKMISDRMEDRRTRMAAQFQKVVTAEEIQKFGDTISNYQPALTDQELLDFAKSTEITREYHNDQELLILMEKTCREYGNDYKRSYASQMEKIKNKTLASLEKKKPRKVKTPKKKRIVKPKLQPSLLPLAPGEELKK